MELSLVIRSVRSVYFLTRLSLMARFQESRLGLLWVLLNPMIMLVIHWTVFSQIMKGFSHGYFLYLFIGFLPWYFVSISHDMGVSSLVYKLKPLKSLSVERSFYSYCTVSENAVIFLFLWSFCCLAGVLSDNFFTVHALLSYVFLLPLMLSVGFSVNILAHFNVRYGDLKHLTSFALKGLLLLTPILYQENAVASLVPFLSLNPFWYYLKPLYILLLEGSTERALVAMMIPVSLSFILYGLNRFVIWSSRKWIYHYEK